MKTNTERIKEFLEKYAIDEAVFNKKAELGNAAVSNNLKNKGSFSEKSLEKILRNYPDIRKEWLYWGKGKMLHSDQDEQKEEDSIKIAELKALIKERDKKITSLEIDIKVLEGQYKTVSDMIDRILKEKNKGD